MESPIELDRVAYHHAGFITSNGAQVLLRTHEFAFAPRDHDQLVDLRMPLH